MRENLTVRYRISGGILQIDRSDIGIFFKRGPWRICSDGYVRNSKNEAIHRHILRAPDGIVVDHINGDPLDNRRDNIRLCSQQQNLWNGRPHRDGSSQYRGVCWNKATGKWRAQIQGKGIGQYVSENEAAHAYNAAALERFGAFAKLNMVPGAGVEPARP